MCDHDYAFLGYLMIYTSDEFGPYLRFQSKGQRGAYPAYMGVAENIRVLQCFKCGDIKFSSGVWEKLYRKE